MITYTSRYTVFRTINLYKSRGCTNSNIRKNQLKLRELLMCAACQVKRYCYSSVCEGHLHIFVNLPLAPRRFMCISGLFCWWSNRTTPSHDLHLQRGLVSLQFSFKSMQDAGWFISTPFSTILEISKRQNLHVPQYLTWYEQVIKCTTYHRALWRWQK